MTFSTSGRAGVPGSGQVGQHEPVFDPAFREAKLTADLRNTTLLTRSPR